MLSTASNCLDKAGSSMDKALSALSAAFAKVLNAPYTKIIKKMKEMAKAKKTTAQMTNQAYTIAAKALSKEVVQKLIDALKATSSQAEWNCGLPPLN
ncbi:hypothetical protein PENTCL1PPCAC_29448, partial [Pristionchus entomophagus]